MTSFANVPIGWHFESGGNIWIKRSSRTAVMAGDALWFYFRKTDNCLIL
jgi:hypothetical protein